MPALSKSNFLTWRGRQSGQFIRVADDINSANPSFENIHREYTKHVALVINDDTRLPVDLREALENICRHEFFAPSKEKATHALRPINGVRHSSGFAAPVGIEHDVFSQQSDQSLHVALCRRLQELP